MCGECGAQGSYGTTLSRAEDLYDADGAAAGPSRAPGNYAVRNGYRILDDAELNLQGPDGRHVVGWINMNIRKFT